MPGHALGLPTPYPLPTLTPVPPAPPHAMPRIPCTLKRHTPPGGASATSPHSPLSLTILRDAHSHLFSIPTPSPRPYSPPCPHPFTHLLPTRPVPQRSRMRRVELDWAAATDVGYRTDRAARAIQTAWRAYRNRRIYRYYRDLIRFRCAWGVESLGIRHASGSTGLRVQEPHQQVKRAVLDCVADALASSKVRREESAANPVSCVPY